MSHEDVMFLNRLAALCALYDQEQGRYPEHEYEGESFLAWVRARLKKQAAEQGDKA